MTQYSPKNHDIAAGGRDFFGPKKGKEKAPEK